MLHSRRVGMKHALPYRVKAWHPHEDRIALNALRRAFKRRFTKPIQQRPRWDEQTRQWVVDRIGDDVRRFLEFYGKPADFWPLDAPGTPTALDSGTVAGRKA